MFVAVILLIAVISDWIISRGLKYTERGHFHTMNALMNESLNSDVIILGNSRAVCSYNPYVLDSILNINSRNLGVSGQPFGVSYLRWQLYRRNNVKPRLLIINVDYAELNMVTNGFEKEQYYPYMHDSLVSPYLDLYGFSWPEVHIPMYRYRGDYKLMSIGLMELLHLGHSTKGNYKKGYANINEPWNGKKLAAVLRKGNVQGQSNQQAVALLDGLLQDAEKEGLNILFVYAPLYCKLKENLDEEASMNEYRKLIQRYDIPFLDYSGMEICYDTAYFMDANHVNEKGAIQFSRELAHAIDSLGLLTKETTSPQ